MAARLVATTAAALPGALSRLRFWILAAVPGGLPKRCPWIGPIRWRAPPSSSGCGRRDQSTCCRLFMALPPLVTCQPKHVALPAGRFGEARVGPDGIGVVLGDQPAQMDPGA